MTADSASQTSDGASRMAGSRTTLSPSVPTSRSTSPHPSVADGGMEWWEDSNDQGFQWIRLPRDLAEAVFRATRGTAEDRNVNETDIPLTATRHDGMRATIWAQLDTGSEVNYINQSTLKALLGDDFNRLIHRLTFPGDFDLVGGHHQEFTHSVGLTFNAGISQRLFENIPFLVNVDNEATADTDGVPNVLLGHEFMKEHRMLWMDLEYCHQADSTLPVLSGRAKDERGGVTSILPVKGVVQRPGFPRPVKG